MVFATDVEPLYCPQCHEDGVDLTVGIDWIGSFRAVIPILYAPACESVTDTSIKLKEHNLDRIPLPNASTSRELQIIARKQSKNPQPLNEWHLWPISPRGLETFSYLNRVG